MLRSVSKLSVSYQNLDIEIIFGGAIVGAVISVPIVIVTVLLAKSLEVGMVADGRLDGWDWFYVLIVPFASALVSGITAYVTVAFKLRRTL